MTPLTHLLIAANIAAFLLELQFGDPLIEAFALWPLGERFAPWQVISSAFLHGSLVHLGANMFGLWMFGRDVERALGPRRFAQLYFVGTLTAAAAQLMVTASLPNPIPTLGASGAVFGVLGAFAVLFPRRRLILLIPPVVLPAPVFVLLYAAVELYSGVYGTNQGVAHFSHLGGLAGGLLLLMHWRRQALSS